MQKLFFILISLSYVVSNAQHLDTRYTLDIDNSVINWKGTYAFQFSEHNGTVHFKEGTLTTINNQITGGKFIIDMTTINNEDHKIGRGPVEHLKDEDFFDVPKHPQASLKITNVNYLSKENVHIITADITIKGITKSQTFNAIADASTHTLTARFKIDRTRWGITYNNNMKDHAISDAVEFDVRLVFK